MNSRPCFSRNHILVRKRRSRRRKRRRIRRKGEGERKDETPNSKLQTPNWIHACRNGDQRGGVGAYCFGGVSMPERGHRGAEIDRTKNRSDPERACGNGDDDGGFARSLSAVKRFRV